MTSVQTDSLALKIAEFVAKSEMPLGTREIEAAFPAESRSKILYRLQALRGDGRIKGRMIPGGAGSWVWYV